MGMKRPLALPAQARRRRLKRRKAFHRKFKPNLETKIFFIVGILVLIAIVNMLFRKEISHFMNTAPYISDIYLPIKAEVVGRSLLGLFYIAFFGSLFFLTVPVEAFFFMFIKAGHFPIFVVLIMAYAACLGHVLNYAVGGVFGRRVMRMMLDPKDQKRYVRRIRSLGMALVFIFNALPLPSQMLSVVLGSLRYRFSRFIFIAFCGQLVKYTFLLVIFQNLVQ